MNQLSFLFLKFVHVSINYNKHYDFDLFDYVLDR